MQEVKVRKFVYMLGSLRRDSYNSIVAEELNSLTPEGVSITSLGSVGDIPHYNADVQAEGFPDAVINMGRQIKEADGLIIITPEYNYSVPGALKNALDWLSRLPDTPVAGKPVAIQTASPGVIGGARAQYQLRQIMVFLDGRVLNKPEIMIGQAGQKIDSSARTITDKDTRDLIRLQLSKLAENIFNA
ncbi:TPA: NAD(P)H-dependent oxidoreductase [Serratia fonticola]|nr:NAD(P)H-dependent oxidoreductase [Serratia fonticola]